MNFEAMPLIGIIQVLAEFDQLNAGGCLFLEIACRRLMAIAGGVRAFQLTGLAEDAKSRECQAGVE